MNIDCDINEFYERRRIWMFFKRKESEAFKWFKDNIESVSISKDSSGFISIEVLDIPIGCKRNRSPSSRVLLHEGFAHSLSHREMRVVGKMLENRVTDKLNQEI